MSAEEFWEDDPQLFISYRTSFINKKKREMEEEDYKSWLRGLYIHDGNGKLMSSFRQFIYNIIAKNKDNTKIGTYPTKPYTELMKEEEKEQKKQLRENKYKEFENSLIYYGTLKQQYKDKLLEKGE